MYHVSAQGIDERMINVHYYYDHLFLANVHNHIPLHKIKAGDKMLMLSFSNTNTHTHIHVYTHTHTHIHIHHSITTRTV